MTNAAADFLFHQNHFLSRGYNSICHNIVIVQSGRQGSVIKHNKPKPVVNLVCCQLLPARGIKFQQALCHAVGQAKRDLNLIGRWIRYWLGRNSLSVFLCFRKSQPITADIAGDSARKAIYTDSIVVEACSLKHSR